MHLLYSTTFTVMRLPAMMRKNEFHHISFSLYPKVLQRYIANANCEKSEFGLEKKKKYIKTKMYFKKGNPAPRRR